MTIDVQVYRLEPNGPVPNNSLCPLLVYPGGGGAVRRGLAAVFEHLFSKHRWSGSWRNGILAMHHWHSTAHEVLGVYAGEVSVQFGGEGGPVIDAGAGDVVVVPAGVAHKRVASSGRLGVVGAYADGRYPDMCTPESTRADPSRVVAAVPLPDCDPVFGVGGPLFDHWRAARSP